MSVSAVFTGWFLTDTPNMNDLRHNLPRRVRSTPTVVWGGMALRCGLPVEFQSKSDFLAAMFDSHGCATLGLWRAGWGVNVGDVVIFYRKIEGPNFAASSGRLLLV